MKNNNSMKAVSSLTRTVFQRWRLRLGILPMVLCLAPVAGQAQDFDAVQITVTPVRDGVYMLQGSGGNIGVSVGDDGVFLVDDQFAPLTDKIVNAIAGLSDREVAFVVNTHFHYDHTDGNENFGRAGAYIVAQDNARRRMEATQVLASGRVQEPYDPVGLPTITFFDAMRFYFNGNAVDLLNTGDGHTDGDVQVYFRDSNIMHTGDMFVRYGLPFIDQANGGTLDGMIDALWKIDGVINDDTILIPGHGQLSSRADLRAFRDMLVVIRGNLVRAKVQGLTPQQMLDSAPAAGYAPANDSTADWLQRAYAEYTD
ncbi:MAG: MBL fold metallo-hydrolase [Gammaproteobacteria bacterium]